ncbi:hypothetical protein MTP03_14290 [Tsukamurella sp. PLM1]|nr:hypothetical protein MTP03_14290 [Tsukamurella sp. PLM1]
MRVADDVLGRPGATESGLQPHGRAALRRRYTRAVIGSAVCAAPFAALAIAMLVAERRDDVSGVPAGWWVVPAALAVAVLALAVPLARIRYAHLGSAVHGGITVLGSGTLARTRTVLESDGVVGFVTTETFFQRRAGVATLHIATAAGAFGATDVTPARAAETARTVEPAIVTSFLTGPGE